MEYVVLKKGREGVVRQRHHWLFSGAIERYSERYRDGELAAIRSIGGQILGYGFFNRKVSLAGRIVTFGEEEPYGAIKRNILHALELRRPFINSEETTAYRLINGEGDGFPGLVIDKYGSYLITQTGALGMRHLLPFILEELKRYFPLKGIYDKSKGGSLSEEKMAPREEILFGEVPDLVAIKEEGIRYEVDLKRGQKTGFFLDQRGMRLWMKELAKEKKVLNAFCYTGGFTLAALAGGAYSVDSVDLSASALQLCEKNLSLNGYTSQLFQEDLFDFLARSPCDYDLAILDPPAFAKKKKDIPAAIKGYKRLFGLTFKKMPSPSLLLLSSCSHYITEPLFQEIVRLSALEAGRPVGIVGHHRLASDHPVNLFHPESGYLKSLLLSL